MLYIRFLLISAVLAALAGAAELPVIPGDSVRGAKLFQTQQCEHCHSVNGKGGKIGIDLGRMVSRKYTPALLASTMWNHGPVMWSAMESAGIEKPKLSPEDAADLFAFFYSARFFDQPGDAARGKQTFNARQCGVCHGVDQSKAEGAPPVIHWESLADPVVLVQQMWNHSYRMHDAFARRHIEWQALTAPELDAIVTYLRSLPQATKLAERFSNTSGVRGRQVFESKGCVNCHKGTLALDDRLHNMTLTDIAVDMWNHAPRMLQPPPTLSEDEMRSLLSYLWMRQFVYGGGNVAQGKKVFLARHCADCHAEGTHGAPALPGQARQFSEVSIISALWRHGPQMARRMKDAGIAWPMFGGPQEVADLIAYLNSVQ
ncbi:MAG TPA: c-type cytochrome [Bryobacteraceae bacterium]|jgi:mono/diheme cytochrome c family protein|nr:c-type cytochrome [Bryobacteraceae bacterium]